jgi:hypothetical protein
MSKWLRRGHFRYLRFKTFSMTLRTPQCEVFWALLSSSKKKSPGGLQIPNFGSVGLHPHTWPKWGCDNGISHLFYIIWLASIILYFSSGNLLLFILVPIVKLMFYCSNDIFLLFTWVTSTCNGYLSFVGIMFHARILFCAIWYFV